MENMSERTTHTHTQKILCTKVCLQSISQIWPKQACFLKLTCSFEMSILQETVCIDSLDAYLIWRGRLAALSFRTTLRLTAEELFNQVNGRKTQCRWNKSGVWSVASVRWRYVTSDLHNSCWTEKKYCWTFNQRLLLTDKCWAVVSSLRMNTQSCVVFLLSIYI